MVKHILSVLAGAVIGAAITLVVVFVYGVGLPKQQDDIVWLEQAGKCLTKENLRVFGIIAPNKALVGEEKDYMLDKQIMLLVTTHNANFYEDQVIRMPAGKCAKHAGNFNFRTREDGVRIVPVVVIN